MYVKYLMERIKKTPSKAWNDWKQWRQWPTMQYRDVYDIIPKSYQWRTPSPGSYKINKEYESEYFKWDYKKPYRDSIYFVRRFYPDFPNLDSGVTNLQIDQQSIDDFSKQYPTFKDYADKPGKSEFSALLATDDIEKVKEHARQIVKFTFEAGPTLNQLSETGTSEDQHNFYSTYFPTVENFGGDKMVDPYDGNPIFYTIYFDSLQYLYDYEEKLKTYNDYKQDVYVGRTKVWQVLPDTHGKEQVDKIQAAIGAPLQDQLDEWDAENSNKFIQMPYTNENVHKFRDDPDYFENIDQDYERIVYERQRKQNFEQMRNTRYDELLNLYYKNHVVTH